jgi:sarcosine oxidase/L-pipecolate oxidase
VSNWCLMPYRSHVILVDSAPFPNPRAASHDINKIIRDDYPDPAYMRLMLEAMPLWRNSPLYSPFYHQTGVLRADPSDFSERCFATYNELGADTPATWISVDEARKRWNGVFATADFEGVEKVMWNPHAGWAAAAKALTAVIQAAVDRGVDYRSNGVEKLLFDGSGRCTGARLRDGSEITANSTLVCAGASTAELLFRSNPWSKSLQAGSRATSTGAVSFYAKWDGATAERFKDVPVFKNCLPKTKGIPHARNCLPC